MRRFHDQLPRPAQAHEESGDDSDGDAWESAEVEGASWRECQRTRQDPCRRT
jgi:hypothetical protein